MRRDEIIDLTAIVSNREIKPRLKVFGSDGKIIQFPLDKMNSSSHQDTKEGTTPAENIQENAALQNIPGASAPVESLQQSKMLTNANVTQPAGSQRGGIQVSIDWRKVLRVVLGVVMFIIYCVVMFLIGLLFAPRDDW